MAIDDPNTTGTESTAQAASAPLDAPQERISLTPSSELWSHDEIRRTLRPDVRVWAPTGTRRILRRLRASRAKATRAVSFLRYTEPPKCNGAYHNLFCLDGGNPFGRRWLWGLPGSCACKPCDYTFTAGRLKSVHDHGGLTSALHFVCTTPSEIADKLTVANLAKLKEGAREDVRETADEVLALDPKTISGYLVIHPTGDDRPTERQEHLDGFASAPGLERLADPALLARFRSVLARRWRRRLSRFAGEVLRPVQVYCRWFGDAKDLSYALSDSLRSFPGWSLGDVSRLSFFGPWRKLPAGDDIPRTVQGEGFGGAVPIETLRANPAAWATLTDEERGHYEGLEAEQRSAEAARERAEAGARLIPAASPRSRAPAAPDDLLDAGIAPGEILWAAVDLDGVGYLDPRCHGSVAVVVAEADATLTMTLRRMAGRIGKLRREGRLYGALPHLAEHLAALRARVSRRRTPSSARAAQWILDRLAVEVPREIRGAPPPVGISGLIDVRELRSLSAALAHAAAPLAAVQDVA